MAWAYSQDLRERVLEAAAKGMSTRQAAERFGVDVSTAIVWVRRARVDGERSARRQGQPKGSKLDVHRDYLLGMVEVKSDITLKEMQARLREEKRVAAGIGTLWRFFRGQDYIRRSDQRQGFEVLPRRWVVERSFGCITRWRRLVRNYEARIDGSQAMILVAMGGNLLRRTTHP